MNLNQHIPQPLVPPIHHIDPVLDELWRVKDARAVKFGNAAGLVQYLKQKYEKNTHH